MRRASYTPLPTQIPQEPLIVVEESGGCDDEDGGGEGGGGGGDEDDSRPSSPPFDSPLLNPCLLTPWRDMRKRSLPTPHCTSGITASQVRRLSEHGVGTDANAAREAAFLATLQQAPSPTPGACGGRRHSVVTISRAPPPALLFGRNRRESIAAFPAGAPIQRVLPPRRDSVAAVPPRPPATSGATQGSTHNLQLDIMDDIAEIKAARKVRLKMWRTPSRERMCEVQPIDDGSGPSTSAGPSGAQPTRYQSRGPEAGSLSRRYSDFVSASGSAALAPPIPPRRRASEQPPAGAAAAAAAAAAAQHSGIVCSNSDLINILSSLASSAQEINREPEEVAEAAVEEEAPQKKTGGGGTGGGSGGGGGGGAGGSGATAEQKRSRLKSLRSNSFDVSMLLGASGGAAAGKGEAGAKGPGATPSRSGSVGPASWFVKRHQPKKTPVVVTYKDEKPNVSTVAAAEAEAAAAAAPAPTAPPAGAPSTPAPVLWDGSGSVVDAQVLGSAIEDFLARRGSGNDGPAGPGPSLPSPQQPPAAAAAAPAKTSPTKGGAPASGGGGKAAGGSWFSAGGKEEEEAAETCDNSICSTLKDLFVK